LSPYIYGDNSVETRLINSGSTFNYVVLVFKLEVHSILF